MSDILKAIYEDTEDYHQICKLYGEKPEKSAYGPHAKKLQERWEKEGRPELPQVKVNISTLEPE